MKTFRECIEARIAEMGTTRYAIEVKNGLKKGYFRDILDRGRAPGLDKIAEICRALETTPDQLFPELRALYPEEAHVLLDRIRAIEEERRKFQKEIEALKAGKSK